MKEMLNNEIKARLEIIDDVKSRIRKLTKARQLIVETEAQIPLDELDAVVGQYMAVIDEQKGKIAKAKKKLSYLAKIDELDEVAKTEAV